ncbi:hypothetical protein BKA65DRAFT_148559 [Rhexocercosporidium sp. MPI-PUGE-AT-0058]|nr:hypothetical protein BKA65DRAFT_148559 [Rhexocercosporidium sp. MPI-PUGE-AT-0058]
MKGLFSITQILLSTKETKRRNGPSLRQLSHRYPTRKSENQQKESAKVQEVPEPEPERADSVSVDQEQEPTSAGSQHDPLEMLTEDFHTLSYPLVASCDNYDGTCGPTTAFEKECSYSKVFLSHASLYVLGRALLIDPLKALALFKLHKTLSTFKLENENIGDITDLARYAYSEDGEKVDEGLRGLKGLVCHYMGRHAMGLSQDTKFLNF